MCQFDNRLEILNEIIISISFYHLLFFTNEISIEMQESYGWSLVAVIALLNILNLLVVFYHQGQYAKLLCIKNYNRLMGRFFPNRTVEATPNLEP